MLRPREVARRLFTSLDPAYTVVHLHTWAKALSSSVTRAAIDLDFPMVCRCTTLCWRVQREPYSTIRAKYLQIDSNEFGLFASQCDARSYPQKLWRVGRQMIQAGFAQIPHGIYDFIAHSELVSEMMRPYLPEGSEIHCVAAPIEGGKKVISVGVRL